MKKIFTVLALMTAAFAAFAQMTDATRHAKIKELCAGSKDPAKLVKETLTTLTPFLLTEQKGQYENMVAKIRTMLGAY